MDARLRLAELVRAGMPELIDRKGPKLTGHQRRGLEAIAQCRTGTFGATMMRCGDCGHIEARMRSCGHRSCPQCQHHTAEAWFERQQAKLLPVPYFMATFTLPAALRSIAYRDPRRVYPALFAAVADTLKAFGRNHRTLHADLGFCAVLHTHTRRLDYHPHLHVVIAGGGIDRSEARTRLWRPLQSKYLFNGFALAKVFRAKFLDALTRIGIALPERLPNKWVVHCQFAGNGQPALKYLSRYLYRGVISERDLIAFDATRRTVTFRYRDGRTRKYQRLTLTLVEFLWRIAVHILPKGLQRTRNFGFLHGNAKRLLRLVQYVLRVEPPPPNASPPKPFECRRCGSTMHTTTVFAPPVPSG